MLSFLAAAVLAAGHVITFAVSPSTTDPAIRDFDNPHHMYVDRGIIVDHVADLPKDRHELLLWLTGTGGKADEARRFLSLAASLGYHVVSLMYPDDVPAATCDYDPDPSAFERFRMAIIQGGDGPMKQGKEILSVPRADSIENRLIKLLTRLQRLRPRENWGQFLQGDGSIRWETLAVAGQSQGGGHAALIGIKHSVERVICFGAPKDFSQRLRAPAAWLSEKSSTPRSRFFAFNHVQDPMGCTPQELWANLQAFEGDAFDKPAQVDQEEFPYRHERVLYTAYPRVTIAGEMSQAAKTAHNSAISGNNAERWNQVWTYLLTEKSE